MGDDMISVLADQADRIAALEAEVSAYREAARYDPMMSGEARFSGWNLSQLSRARRLSEAARSNRSLADDGFWCTIPRARLALHLAALDGIRLQDIRSTVGPAEDANNWRDYLGKADDLLAFISADIEGTTCPTYAPREGGEETRS